MTLLVPIEKTLKELIEKEKISQTPYLTDYLCHISSMV